MSEAPEVAEIETSKRIWHPPTQGTVTDTEKRIVLGKIKEGDLRDAMKRIVQFGDRDIIKKEIDTAYNEVATSVKESSVRSNVLENPVYPIGLTDDDWSKIDAARAEVEKNKQKVQVN